MIKGILLPSAVLGVFVCAAAAQTTPSSTSPKTTPAPAMPKVAPETYPDQAVAYDKNPCRVSKLFGKDIMNTNNEKVGSLKDVVVDDSGKLYAIVKRSDGKFAGLPMESLTPRMEGSGEKKAYAKDAKPEARKSDDKAKFKEFILTTGADKLNDAPLTNDVSTIDRAWLVQVRDHFAGTNSSNPTGIDSAATSPSRIFGFDKLIGTEVKTSTGEEVGKIEDIAVTTYDARLAYVLVSTGGVLGMGTSAHGVAWKSLTPEVSGNACIITMDKATLEKSPGIDLDNLPVRPDLALSASNPANPGPVSQEPRR